MKAVTNTELSKNIFRYLSGEMSNAEQHKFEKKLQKDPFLVEAVEGFEGFEPKNTRFDLNSIANEINKRVRRKSFLFYRIVAAIIVVIAISSLLLFREFNKPQLLSENTKTKINKEADKVQEPYNEIIDDISEPNIIKSRSEISSNKHLASEIVEKDKSQTKTINAQRQETQIALAEEFEADEMVETIVEPKEKIAYDMLSSSNVASTLKAKAGSTFEKSSGNSDMDRKRVSKSVRAVQAMPNNFNDSSVRRKNSLHKGRVLASFDNIPLGGVNISNTATSSYTKSDSKGKFEISADSGDILIFSAKGLFTRELALSGNNINDIYLDDDITELDDIVVRAYKAQNASSEKTAYSKVKARTKSKENKAQQKEGISSYEKYLSQELVFPPDWLKSDKEIIKVRFKVSLNGDIKAIEIVKSPDVRFSKEAIRALKEGPKWPHAQVNNQNIEETVNLRIVFKR